MKTWLLSRSWTRFAAVVAVAWVFASATGYLFAALHGVVLNAFRWSLVVVLQIGFQLAAAGLSDWAANARDTRRESLLGSFALALAVLVVLSETIIALVQGPAATQELANSTLVGQILCSANASSCFISYNFVSIVTMAFSGVACVFAAACIRADLRSEAEPHAFATLVVMSLSSVLFSFSFLLLFQWDGVVTQRIENVETGLGTLADTEVGTKLRGRAWVYLLACALGLGILMTYMARLLSQLNFNSIELSADWLKRFGQLCCITAVGLLRFLIEVLVIAAIVFGAIAAVIALLVGVYASLAIFVGLVVAAIFAVQIAFVGLGEAASAIGSGTAIVVGWIDSRWSVVGAFLTGSLLLSIAGLAAYKLYRLRAQLSLSALLLAVGNATVSIFAAVGAFILWYLRGPFRVLATVVIALLLLPAFWWPFSDDLNQNSENVTSEEKSDETADVGPPTGDLPTAAQIDWPQNFEIIRMNCDPWSRIGQPRWAYNSAEFFDSTVDSCQLLTERSPVVLVVFGNASRDDSSVGAFDLSLRRATALAQTFSQRYPNSEVILGVLGRRRGASYNTALQNLFASDRAAVIVGSGDVIPPIPFAIASVDAEVSEILRRRNILGSYEHCLLGRPKDFENWERKLPIPTQTDCEWIVE